MYRIDWNSLMSYLYVPENIRCMDDSNSEVFIALFREAYAKCFGHPLVTALSETESKHFSNAIFDETGLVIGAKSIKNYSFYVVSDLQAKEENPSVATLDTLARYVLSAPYTDETQRKAKEFHYPFWFRYKSTFTLGKKEVRNVRKIAAWKGKELMVFAGLLLITALLISIPFHESGQQDYVTDFHSLQDDTLQNDGWFVKSEDSTWWKKRAEKKRHLTLFTLRGDNWPDSANKPLIKNLLLRKLPGDCFSVEIHLDSFFPRQNWQQAGILLLEDTLLGSHSIRLSLAYNDFFGGYKKPGEIIIQAITSGGKDPGKPEEFAHFPLFSLISGEEGLVYNNLKKSALKIEKRGDHFRFLYSAAPIENFAFKEVASRDLLVKPKYVGIFAFQGFVADTAYVPAHFNFFSLLNIPCQK